MIFNMTGGNGGGLELAFRVIASPNQPSVDGSTPVVLWVPTSGGASVDITDRCYFSVSDPKTIIKPFTRDKYWFKIGTSSNLVFPAIKDNALILVQPVKCYYNNSNGVWVEKQIVAYSNGKWGDATHTYIYLPNNQCVGITGGWAGYSTPYSGTTGTIYVGTITDEGYQQWNANDSGGMTWRTNNKVDLTDCSKIIFEGSYAELASTGNAWYCAWSDIGTTYQQNVAASVKITSSSNAKVEIDVSGLSGEYYIGVGFRSCLLTVKKCYLE